MIFKLTRYSLLTTLLNISLLINLTLQESEKSIEITVNNQQELETDINNLINNYTDQQSILENLTIKSSIQLSAFTDFTKLTELKIFANIKELKLDFYGNKIISSTLSPIGDLVKNLKKLETLELLFKWNQITDLENVAKIISNSPQLKQFETDMEYNDIGILTPLVFPLNQQKSIENLTLKFGKNIHQIDVLDGLFKNCQSVKQLDISLGHKISDFRNFTTALSNFDSLEYFKLKIYAYQVQDLVPIGDSIKKIPKLKKLDIDIEGYSCRSTVDFEIGDQIIFEEKSCRAILFKDLYVNTSNKKEKQTNTSQLTIVYTLIIGSVMLIFLCIILGYAKKQLDRQIKKNSEKKPLKGKSSYQVNQNIEVPTSQRDIQSNCSEVTHPQQV